MRAPPRRPPATCSTTGPTVRLGYAGPTVHATVEGDSGTWAVTRGRLGGWDCTCPNRRTDVACSHVLAVAGLLGVHIGASTAERQESGRMPA